jgi:hypothetical protein
MIVSNREEYYSQEYVLYELVKCLKYTYLSSRKVNSDGKAILTRYYLGYSLDILKKSLEKLNAHKDKSVKLYYDLALWKDEKGNTPLFNFDTEKRELDKEKFNDNFKKYMVGFDFAIDLDSDDGIDKSYLDAKKIKNLFDKYKLPYTIKFSGGRGFHFVIRDFWFNARMCAINKVKLYGRMAMIIRDVCKIKSHSEGGTFDDSIYDDRRIFKLPYSLQNKDGIEYVCLPLDDEQFNKFKLEDMKMSNVLQKVKIFKRGLLERTHGLNEKELKRSVALFLKEMK